MYVLLGSNGNITSKVASHLLAQGVPVRVVGRNAKSLGSLSVAGADIATGDIADADFLARTFADATAVYSMIPPGHTELDMVAAQDRRGEAIARAIQQSGVKRVVNLSSIGAHRPSGTGPIAGLHRQEQRLNAIEALAVLHLRPGYFFENHLAALQMIPAIGVYSDMTAPDAPLPMVATSDIAKVIARELLGASVSGKRVLHLHAPRLYTMRESAAILGASIGQPELAYVQADLVQGKAALRAFGLSASGADQIAEMSAAFSAGLIKGEFENGPTEIAPTTLERFAATIFKPAYLSSSKSIRTGS
jgi:uncharacterized protein YbjT (DUF2867 family)